MNKKPVYYKQSDRRWSGKPYRVPGETSTIGSAGCGPSCAAMVIASLKDRSVTPETTCAWSVAHGYKALKQGTYYSYFKPQMAVYGIECEQLLGSRILNQPNHPIHERVQEYLKKGDWIIALMGPGTWTKSGHFVLVWNWDSKVRILDPASSADNRLNGDNNTFLREVRCYWRVNAREYNTQKTEEDVSDMTIAEFVDKLTDEQAYMLLTKAQRYAGTLSEPEWSIREGHWARAKDNAVINGGNPEGLIKRDEVIAILGRKGLV